MLQGLFIASLISTCIQGVKESMQSTMTAEKWGDKELIYKDIMDGVPAEQRLKNAKNGKYIVTEKEEPHKNERGQIVIENSLLYDEDVQKYGAYQAQQWMKQGKYNLNEEELKKEEERIKKKFEYLYSLL